MHQLIRREVLALLNFRIPFFIDNSDAEFHAEYLGLKVNRNEVIITFKVL